MRTSRTLIPNESRKKIQLKNLEKTESTDNKESQRIKQPSLSKSNDHEIKLNQSNPQICHVNRNQTAKCNQIFNLLSVNWPKELQRINKFRSMLKNQRIEKIKKPLKNLKK